MHHRNFTAIQMPYQKIKSRVEWTEFRKVKTLQQQAGSKSKKIFMKNLIWVIFNLILQTYMDKNFLKCLQKKTYQVPLIRITKVHLGQWAVYTSNPVCIILGTIAKREIMEDLRLHHNSYWMLKVHHRGHNDHQQRGCMLQDLAFLGIVYQSHQWLYEYQKQTKKFSNSTKGHSESTTIKIQHQRTATAPLVMEHLHNHNQMQVAWWISWDFLVQAWTSKAHLTIKALAEVQTLWNLQLEY